MAEETMFKDKVFKFDNTFKDKTEFEAFVNSRAFIDLMIAEEGEKLPFLFEAVIEGNVQFIHIQPAKQGIPMDWHFYAGFKEITKKDIQTETNIEKRRLLMMEFGVANFFDKIKELNTDAYGSLIETKVDGERQLFIKVRNGTEEQNKEYIKYLKSKKMLYGKNQRIYYIPVADHVTTAREAVAWSWDVPIEWLPETGFDLES